ncbi:hypothetical protein BZG36_05416 [Bifiguratus adelaidae]|uniref:Amidohydrolase-related domain-containing protein n=1 Tax=Bifiguratus adelaidae TaxID=1938954 RepID=A0A261XTR1_9FUNG|nr:hypothetical protein BZG36_05416 [Bifiguratus adelaidae]
MHKYDTLIQGGTVVDVIEGKLTEADIAVVDGTIVDIAPRLSASEASHVFDATGQYVLPGLVDMHTHVYWGSTYWGIEPDPVAARTGVTTWIDAGSSGAYSFAGFKEFIIQRSQSRIFPFLHISGIGLVGRTHESHFEDQLDVQSAVEIIQANRGLIRGLKVRMDRDSAGAAGLLGLQKAREVADQTGLPIMVHIGIAPPSLEDIVYLLRKGDILTHCFTGHTNRLVDATGKPLPVVKLMRDKGIILDIGHGTGSFSWSSADGLTKHDVIPDVISSDLHQLSRVGVVVDLPTTLGKCMSLGLSFIDCIRKATIVPAQLLGLHQDFGIGALTVGGPADIAVFEMAKKSTVYKDSFLTEREFSARLVHKLTLIRGKPISNTVERQPHPWTLADMAQVAGLSEDRC